MPDIHPTAVVEDGATLADDVRVGAYAVVGAEVTLGPGTVVQHHASVVGSTTVGAGCTIFPFASVGSAPQDLKYHGEKTRLEIGDRNTIREFVTMNLGTVGGGGVTRVGSGNLFMAYCHVAHDCTVGNQVIMANSATLAGHVSVEDGAIIGGLTGVHQFARIGRDAIVGGCTAADMDIPPFTMAAGVRAHLHGLNLIGLKRKGFSPELIAHLKSAYRIVFRSALTLQEALVRAEAELPPLPEVRHFLDFLRHSERGVTRPER